MPRNCETPRLLRPSTWPSAVVTTGAACAPVAVTNSKASIAAILRIQALLLVFAMNIADDLPDFVRCHLVLPGRHAAWRAFGDGVKYLARLAAILPAIIGQVRTHATGQVIGMAADAVHLAEQGVPRLHRIGFAFERIGGVRRHLRQGRRGEHQQSQYQPSHQLCAAAGGTETGAATSEWETSWPAPLPMPAPSTEKTYNVL